jgi:hypothetical protein
LINASGGSVIGTALQAGTTLATLDGLITTTAAGNLQLTFASEIEASAVNILAGSFLRLELI